MELSLESNLQKKIERIAQAIYLVSNHLKDTEPLKWEMRKEALSFLTCVRSLGDESDGRNIPADLVMDTLTVSARDLISYLSLASISGLISHNNGDIVVSEITSLLSTFERVVDENTAKAGFILSEDFFAGDPELSQNLNGKIRKGQNMNLILDTTKTVKKIEPKENAVKDKKGDRQERIIALLKTQQNLTIKDFVKVISDCSEKTIQRELIELVGKGVIKKEGERRWSTYSLK